MILPPPPHSPGRWSRLDAVAVLALLAGSLFITGSLWLGGAWFTSHEMMHQLVRLLEFDGAIRGGQFPVRWCDNLNAGYGHPFFNFYGPMSFGLAEVFHWGGLSLTSAWKAEVGLLCWLGAVGMYGFLRRRTGRFGAAAGAMLFLFAPYHVLTLYVRGNLAELTALNIWPWAFWGADAVARSGRDWRGMALPAGALAIGALVASHVLTAYMAALNLVAWALFLAWESRTDGGVRVFARRLGWLAALGVFGAAVGAFFWLPALHDIRYCMTSVLYERTQFQDHYVQWLQLLSPKWGFGDSIRGPDDGMSFQLGIALWLGVVAALWGILRDRRGKTRTVTGFALAMVAVHLFAMTAWSRLIWEVLPGAAYLQFPWRLLIPATFWASLAGGLAAGAWAYRIGGFAARNSRILAVAILSIPAVLVAPFLHPLLFYLEVPDYRREILAQIWTDTAEGEYLPIWVDEPPARPSTRSLLWGSAKGTARLIDRDSASYRFQTAVDTPGAVAIDLFWFPGWRVFIDGEETPSNPVTRHGLIGWNIPAGKHDVVVEFGDTPLRRSANGVSLAALLLALLWISTAVVARLRHPTPRTPDGSDHTPVPQSD